MFVLSPGRLFVEILNSCTDCDEIQFMEDGSWCPMKLKKEKQEMGQTSVFSSIEGTGAFSSPVLWLGCQNTWNSN